jgi:O-antigen/teichoic acid export membrane protein
MVLIFIFSPLLIPLISTIEYLDAMLLIPFTVLAVVMTSLSYFWRMQLDLVEKPQLTGLIYLISAFVLAFACVVLIPPLGILGVGVAIVAQAFCVLVLLVFAGNSYMPIEMKKQYWTKWIGANLALVVAFLILQYFALPDLVSGLGSLLVYLLTIWITGLLRVHSVKTIIRLLVSRPAKE